MRHCSVPILTKGDVASVVMDGSEWQADGRCSSDDVVKL
jgi:hypothetical protein